MHKDGRFQDAPKTPDFSREAKEAVEYEGLPPLAPKKSVSGTTVFKNVKSVTTRVAEGDGIATLFDARDESLTTVVIRKGKIACVDASATCLEHFEEADAVIDLKGGAISPGLISFGSPLGLEEIEAEPSTADGYAYDQLTGPVPGIVGGDTSLIRAVDGLQFATRDA